MANRHLNRSIEDVFGTEELWTFRTHDKKENVLYPCKVINKDGSLKKTITKKQVTKKFENDFYEYERIVFTSHMKRYKRK